MKEKVAFHGGCSGCTQQDKHGTYYCRGCCFFDANWDKPSLSNRPPTQAEIERKRITRKLQLRNIIPCILRVVS